MQKNTNKDMKSIQLSFKTMNLKVNHHTGGKWFIHGTKHHKENIGKPGIPADYTLFNM